MGLVALIPVSLLLTVSYFVLLSQRIAKRKELKNFGYLVAVLLWISAAVVLFSGIYTLVTGRHPLMDLRMHEMMMRGPMSGMISQSLKMPVERKP
jgi:hypothetical protein